MFFQEYIYLNSTVIRSWGIEIQKRHIKAGNDFII